MTVHEVRGRSTQWLSSRATSHRRLSTATPGLQMCVGAMCVAYSDVLYRFNSLLRGCSERVLLRFESGLSVMMMMIKIIIIIIIIIILKLNRMFKQFIAFQHSCPILNTDISVCYSTLTLHSPVVTICTASLTFNNSTFCPHSVFMCFVWISEQTAIISLYNII